MKWLLMIVMLLSGCGSKDSSSDSSSDPTILEGTWKSECIDLGDEEYEVVTLTYEGNKSVMLSSRYQNPNCIDSEFVFEEKKSLTLGDQVEGLTNTYKIDYKLISTTLTIKKATWIESLNNDGAYGYVNWELDTAKDVTELTYEGDKDPSSQKDSMTYLIIKIDGNKLYGADFDTGDGNSKDTRPTALNTTIFLEKQ